MVHGTVAVVKNGDPFYYWTMPRVSEEYLERRRQQILDAARRCFARQGFHETSMQDVFAESGLSAGAVYRYFKKKDDLIVAIADGVLGQLAAVMDGALAESPLPGLDEIAIRVTTVGAELSGPDGPSRLAPALWAEALHEPALAEVAAGAMAGLRSRWVAVVRRLADEGRLPADVDAEAAGAALFSIVPGFLLQHLILGDVDPGTIARGMRVLLRPELLAAPASCTSL